MRPNTNLLVGEKEAILEIIRLARIYGFGNIIAHLKRQWAIDLKIKYGGNYQEALVATDVDAYPEAWDIEKL